MAHVRASAGRPAFASSADLIPSLPFPLFPILLQVAGAATACAYGGGPACVGGVLITLFIVAFIFLFSLPFLQELHLHASAGRPEFTSVAERLWGESSMLALCFDVTNESSFASVPRWLERYKDLNPGRTVRGAPPAPNSC